MADRRHVARTLILVGMLLLPAPLYIGVVADAFFPAPRGGEHYHAETINLDTESGIDSLAGLDDRDVTVTQYNFKEDPVYSHQWNTSTWQVLTTAMTNGSITVSDDQIRDDLQEIETKYQFVREDSDDERQYYRINIEQNDTIVRTDPASYREVATAIAEQAPHYENLTAAEKETVDKILNASAEDSGSYRPRVNEPVSQGPIWKGYTLYRIEVTVHTDPPNFRNEKEFVAGVGLSVIGIGLALLGRRMGNSD